MRIPSGDLSPARRRRQPSGRGRSPVVPVLLALALLAGVAAGALLLRRDDGQAAAGACGTAVPGALRPVAAARDVGRLALPAPAAVRVRVLNGTARDGLARTVGGALAARGFAVLDTVNAPGPLPGRSQVRFGPGGRRGATLLSAHVSGSALVAVPQAPRGSVELVLGTAFVRLRTAAEVTTVQQRPARPAPAATTRPASPAAAPC